jgi:hypothetical protein
MSQADKFAITLSNAPAPFDHRDADLIIRSSDGVQFRVFKLFLSLASVVFRDMFLLPQQNEDNTLDGLPVVELTETSNTIHNMLSLCYPTSQITHESLILSDVVNLLEVTRKYDMEGAQKVAMELLTKPRFLTEEPLRVYAIACRLRNGPIAKLAAKSLSHRKLLEDTYSAELELCDGGTIYRVLSYHKRYIEAAVNVVKDHRWIRLGQYAFINCPGAVRENGALRQ